METKEQIQSEMYHSFISEMSMYMSPNVHVSKSTYISKSIQKYIYIQKYPEVHVSKTIQATCTCIEMYIYPIRHIKTQASSCSFPMFYPLGTTVGLVCVSGSLKLNINC